MKPITIAIINSWTSEEQLRAELERQRPPDSNVTIVSRNEPHDFLLIINADPNAHPSTYKGTNALYFCMEPRLPPRFFGDWSRASDFLDQSQLCTHAFQHNLVEFHLSSPFNELLKSPSKLDAAKISVIQSNKRDDIGQKKRLDFVLALNEYLAQANFVNGSLYVTSPLDCFGTFQPLILLNRRGVLPYKQKGDGLAPYKYHFAAENNAIDNYFTEKIVDGILMECLVFYWGCPNLEEYLPAESFVRLELEDMGADCATIERAIKEDWWSARLPAIKEAKHRILYKLSFFPHVEEILRARLVD